MALEKRNNEVCAHRRRPNKVRTARPTAMMMDPSVEGATVGGVDADADADVSLEAVVELPITIELPSAMMCTMDDAEVTGTTHMA